MTDLKTIGVCGAGTMGSQLAALFASAGFDVLLYDLEKKLSEAGLEGALAAKPAAFFDKKLAERVTPLDYEEDLDRIGECDWIIEAIAERLDWKQDLYAKLQPLLKPTAVLSSNTSGLPLASLIETMDAELQERFLITHFFNPPRYMRLVEVVPGPGTDPEIFASMKIFLSETLGKGVVEAKDTPNFIANRVGTFGMMMVLKVAQEMRLSVEQVDAISGPVMGRPKSATFRTADLVGLDVLAAVAETAYERCPDDEQRDLYKLPELLETMIERGWLGQKTKAGFYKKQDKEILALDFESLEYHPKDKPRMDGIGVARRYTDLGRRLHALVYNPDSAGRFAWEVTIGTLAYAANRVGEIADDIVEIDRAMRWGFGWEMGPFEIWDAIGIEKSVRRMRHEGKPVPELVESLLTAGQSSFYSRDTEGASQFFDPSVASPEPIATEAGAIVLADRKAAGKEIFRNWSASLVDLDDGVACVEFHSALQPDFNPIDGAIIDLLDQSLRYATEQKLHGLVISHDGTHFCAGANLALILELARAKKFDVIEMVSKTLQDITQFIKYAPFPVVAAPFSMTLGGGFEMVAPCAQIVALAELYCGAVEVGVGLIPGAGGNLRVLEHFLEKMPPKKLGPMMAVQKAFETIGFAKVSTSAHHAKKLGYLRDENKIVLSRAHQIAVAKQMVMEMAPGYAPPEPPELVLPGKGGQLAIKTAITGYRMSGKISKHDAHIAKGLAHVLTGGTRANGVEPVDEQYLLDLEREIFVSLAGERLSQDRMEHMLKTGKPLRN